MRTLKFRAWDNVKNRMLYVGEESDIVFEPTDTGFKAVDIAHEEGEPNYYLDHLEYMQYTGLTDKNGKQIYEGDIVEATDYMDGLKELPGTITSRVSFKNGCFELTDHIYSLNRLLTNYDELEVIGNIYEDKELIP
ncbi:YopX family protein [Sediminibacillus massiliensis]|uniref:YopX family protein n=1 Tax=Sediminibacillus massiliensis TaxID=1926277 RepID=UPI0009885BB5|nr:YopX family protein [Sediminibacillus massiliensis]